jgi:hypothetical protein
MGQGLKFYKQVITALAAAEVKGPAPGDQIASVREIAGYVVFGAGTSAGQVVLETAHDPDYAGAWWPLETIDWAAASKVHHVGKTGLFRALRFRISIAIVGGTVDAYLLAN